jgi:valyl-tRNA synthetase
VKGWQVADVGSVCCVDNATNKTAVAWMEARIKQANEELKDHFSKYRINDALMTVYKLFWDEFSQWYLEMIKPAYRDGQQQPIDRETYDATLRFFELLLKMLHPFMPFITEELWQALYERNAGESIMRDKLELQAPTANDLRLIADIEQVKQVVSGVRTVRSQKNIAPKEKLTLHAIGQNPYEAYNDIIAKMAGLTAVQVVDTKEATASAFMVGTDEYAVPLGDLIDVTAEIEKMEAQLKHLEGFLAGVQKKLGNERFVQNAPEAVVALERKKQSDAEEKIAALKASINALKK